ncbi:MAG: hypothetical protein U0529_23040 [Thermoanaerobaculia bacterium]
MANALSRTLAVLVVVLLGAPAALRPAGLPERPLVGRVAEAAVLPPLTLRGWLDGSFQRGAEIRANQAFALRTWLVRLNDELAFRLWGRAKANGVLVGPGPWLSDRAHVEAWSGADFVGEEAIRAKLGALARLDAALAARGGAALLVVLPSKATARPDLVPRGTRPPSGPRNRETYARLAAEAGAPFLDLTPRLLLFQQGTGRGVFSPYGIHWTEPAVVLGMQEVLARLGERTGRRPARIEVLGVEETDRIAPVDRDIADGMNLLFPLPKVRLAYPRVRVDGDGAWRPRVLAVADSNFWNVFDLPLAREAFSSLRFWFYGNDLHEHGAEVRYPKGDAEVARLVDEADVVLLLASETNLPRLGWGFLERSDRLLAARETGASAR